MYKREFTNFNFIYNCIKFPTSDAYIVRNEMLKELLLDIWFKTLDKFNNYDTTLEPLEYIYCGVNKFKKLNSIKTRDLRELFITRKCESIDFNKIKNIFNFEQIQSDVFKNMRKFTVSSKLRFTHYRLLHSNIYTRDKLFKIGLVKNPLCINCLDKGVEHIETINHFFFDCNESISCWQASSDLVSTIINENIYFCKNKVLFGSSYKDSKYDKTLNSILAKLRNNFIQINRPV